MDSIEKSLVLDALDLDTSWAVEDLVFSVKKSD